MADKYRCRECHKTVTASGQNPSPLRYRKHDKEKGAECPNSRTIIPAWLVKRGPETEDSDAPAIGRDYAPCPECQRSPLLDDQGCFLEHVTNPGVPAAGRIVCPQSGQPYEAPEGEACTTEPPASGESQSAPTAPASTAMDVRPAAGPVHESAVPNESEEMISKWAAAARAIEDRELPPPSPESTTTPPASPSPTSEPASATTDGGPEPAPSMAATEAPTSSVQSNGTGTDPEPKPCHIVAPHPPHRWMHRKQPTPCPGKPAPQTAPTESVPAPNSAADAAAASEAAPSSTKDSVEGRRLKTDPMREAAARTKAEAAEPSTAATPPTPRDAPPSSDVPPDIAALAGIFPEKPPPPGEPWYVPDAGGGEPINIRELEVVGQSEDGTLTLDRKESEPALFAQPGSPFAQPEALPAAVTSPIPMTVLAEQVAARMKEIFYSFDNRKTSDNRSAQATLGPSEIGTPCDRRLAMSLLGIPAVNPGGDGWAAFVGTCIHAGLAEMFMWADAGTGRFAAEVPLTFPNQHVPGGTSDLLDRVLFMVDDHKAQGRWSLDKLKTQGMTPTQRVQLHTYGYGQRLKGEVVDYVALISWPREASSLADLYVVVEPYDPQIARDALARVDHIAMETDQVSTRLGTSPGGLTGDTRLAVAREFAVADDCKFCPFFAPGDPGMLRGCNGRT